MRYRIKTTSSNSAQADTSFAETCERGWREHEEFSSKKISVLREGTYPPEHMGTGFTLIEAVIYIAIFGLIASSLISLALSSSVENGRVMNDVINAYENH